MSSAVISREWEQFLEFAKGRCSAIAFGNWLAPIRVIGCSEQQITLEVPNVFVQEYLLCNYKKDLAAFLPLNAAGDPGIEFRVAAPPPKPKAARSSKISIPEEKTVAETSRDAGLNGNYSFQTFIEGPTNQFVKSAAVGIAARPGTSYNPLFIHGGVGLGKTHILHSIGHHVIAHHKKLKVQCITTEGFINELVDGLRNRSTERIKRFYRSDIDVLLVDDIQFLQNRANFEEEFCNTFETLIHQNKQIVITSDKSPSQLKLSDRMIARMQWGLVSCIGMPDLETRVAILQHKAARRGLKLHNDVAFFISERICHNVRQLEGAINRLSAYGKLVGKEITEEIAATALKEMLQPVASPRISIEQILKSVAAVFEVRLSEIKSDSRLRRISEARQVAMYLACKLIRESLTTIATYFGRTHSTLLHACKNIEKGANSDELLFRKIAMAEKQITT